MIQCNEIAQTISYLQSAFEKCKSPKAEDMQLLVELIAAVNMCANGGPNYDTLITQTYNPIYNETITYAPRTYHSISIMIVSGNIIKDNVTYNQGTVFNYEFTTLNKDALTFTVTAGSIVTVEYIVETIET